MLRQSRARVSHTAVGSVAPGAIGTFPRHAGTAFATASRVAGTVTLARGESAMR